MSGRESAGKKLATGRAMAMSAQRLKPYPTYKDSGVEWLGEIPAHWEVKRLKTVASLHTGGTPPGLVEEAFEEDGVLWVKPDHLQGDRGITPPDRKLTRRTAESIGIVRAGSVLVCGIGTVGKIGYADTDVCTNQQINAISFRPVVLDRFARFLSLCLEPEFVRRANKVTIAICNKSEMAEVPLCVPPKPEQRAIAAFLDRETARIEVLVAKQERLIELLQEKRTALITRAVTKGLDPTAPMKDSGVEWLGEIPAHWEVAPVYARYEVALGKMLDAKRITGEFSGRYLRNVDVQWDRVNTQDLPEMDFAPWEWDRYMLRTDDLLVCEGGEVGRTAIWGGELDECFYQKAIHRVRPRSERETPRFFYFLMSMLAARGVFASVGNQNTIDHLTAVQLKHYRFPFAPAKEQRAIAAFLDRETIRIDAFTAKVREAIDRLKEYRTALISAAVTGKIDVREEAASKSQASDGY